MRLRTSKSALEGDDIDAIQAKTAALAEASGGLAQRLYAEQAEQEGGDAAHRDAAADDVVDAEFEEVDDDELKKIDRHCERSEAIRLVVAKNGRRGDLDPFAVQKGACRLSRRLAMTLV